ncbi:MAG TPA: flagellar hook-associated protein FlgK [Burkholderiaceae bacterium]|jgi:flagellar hook-associated protein 1 FlgK
MSSSLLQLGVTGMFANQAALQTIGQNIANANTPGYSRQSVVLTTPPGQFTGAGFFGKGVSVDTVIRSHNDFLTTQAAAAKSTASMDQTHSDALTQLEKIFPTGDAGLGSAASTFFNNLINVANSPADPSARQVTLSGASELASRFASAGSQLADLQSGVVSDLKADVSQVNQLAQQIAQANAAISASNGSGQSPNDLLDQRDQLISKLSTFIQVSTLPSSDGSMGVFIGGGQRLVLGSQSQDLAVTADPYDPTKAQVAIQESNGPRTLDPSVLTGGSITARLLFQNDDLAHAKALLGQMGTALGARVNQQQALGLDLSNPPGTGVPIFGTSDPKAMPAVTNARTADGTYATSVGITITDASQLQASDYRLRPAPDGTPGIYQLTRMSDGKVSNVADGDTIDGFKISINGATMAQGDSFELHTVSDAAINMKAVLSDPNGIAAAAPLTASVAAANTGTATVESLYAVNSNVDPTNAPMTINFTGPNAADSTKMDYTLSLANGTVLTGTWTAGKPIGNEPDANPAIDLGFELQLNGVPRAGDSIEVDPTQFTGNNNGNAKAFLNMQTEDFVGRQLLPDGSLSPGANINDAYAAAMGDIGARVQGSNYLATVSASVSTDAETSRSNQAGVNIDEEAARLMQFQQGYQASAKVLQTAQTLFQKLLEVVSS